ncbi:glycosyltransferase [Flavobacteriaceae bacterium]|nr:glycosyltransferase [Flavobacteriaceae bacterium]
MKISIITATYNSNKSLKSCIDSVVMQDYGSIEYIIIDGQSTDSSIDIVNDFQTSYPYIKVVSENDDGIYDALNKGLAIATGDVIGFLHSDDLFPSSTIISELASKINNDNLDGIYGDLQYVNKENTNKIIRLWKSCEFKLELLKKGWMPAHPTLFLKKHVYYKHGEFNTSYKISADYDFMLRILKDKTLKFGYLPRVITKMRVGGASNRSFKNIIRKTKEDYNAVCSNNVGGWFSIFLKNTTKLRQFIIKKQ